MKEIWRQIPFTGGTYEVSNIGRLRSWIKQGGQSRRSKPTLLKLSINQGGYLTAYCKLKENGLFKNIRIHRIVAELFLDNPLNFKIVNHKDGNKLNNSVDNLEWCDSTYNNQHAFFKGLIIPAMGENRKKSSLKEVDVLTILASKETCRALGKKYSVNHTSISAIRSGKAWNHITGLPLTRTPPKYSKHYSI